MILSTAMFSWKTPLFFFPPMLNSLFTKISFIIASDLQMLHDANGLTTFFCVCLNFINFTVTDIQGTRAFERFLSLAQIEVFAECPEKAYLMIINNLMCQHLWFKTGPHWWEVGALTTRPGGQPTFATVVPKFCFRLYMLNAIISTLLDTAILIFTSSNRL